MDTCKKRTSALILEGKLCDLESQLTNANHALRRKEHVLCLQQEQLRKLEVKYKQSLDDMASVTCAHKKTLNDMGNLKIILKSYKQRSETNKHFDCQVDLLEITLPQNNELEQINQVLLIQAVKADQIMELIQSSNVERFEEMESCICELQKISLNLLETSTKESSSLLKLVCDDSTHFPTHTQIERGLETKVEHCDYSCNYPEGRFSSQTEISVMYTTIGSITDSLIRSNKLIASDDMILCHTYSQTPFFEDVLQLRNQLAHCEIRIEAIDNLLQYESDLGQHVHSIMEHFNENETEMQRYGTELLKLQQQLKHYEARSNQDVEALSRLAMVTKELQESQSIINYLQVQIESYETQSNSVNELKTIYRSFHEETIDFRREQIGRLKRNYEVEIAILEKQLEEARARDASQDISTQVDLMYKENEQLVQYILDLEKQLQQHTSMKELQELFVELRQTVNNMITGKKENNLLHHHIANVIDSGEEELVKLCQLHSSSSMPLLLNTPGANTRRELQRSSSDSCLNNGKAQSKDMFWNVNNEIQYVLHDTATNAKRNREKSILRSMETFLKDLIRQLREIGDLMQIDNDKRRSLTIQNEELLNCLMEYRVMNEMLLKTNCELEAERNCAREEHQMVLQDYIKLQNLMKLGRNEQATNTTFGDCALEAERLMEANLENDRLRQEVERFQITGKSCEKCQVAMRTLKSLNDAFAQVSSENEVLLKKLEEREGAINGFQLMYEEGCMSKDDVNTLHSICNQLQMQNDCLQMDANELKAQLRSSREEHILLSKDLDDANGRCKCLSRDLEAARVLNIERINRQDHDQTIQEYLRSITRLNEKCTQLELDNHALSLELSERDGKTMDCCLECDLKNAKEAKANLEHDFNNYIQMSTMLQQNVDQQNKKLIEEVAALGRECECQKKRIQLLTDKQLNHNQELSNTKDECSQYKCKLQRVLSALERQKEGCKEDLRNMLSRKNKSRDEHLRELYVFIEQCELEINEITSRKTRAIDTVNLYFYIENKKCTQMPVRLEAATITTNEHLVGKSAKKQVKSKRARSLPARSQPHPGEQKRAFTTRPPKKRY